MFKHKPITALNQFFLTMGLFKQNFDPLVQTIVASDYK